MESDKEKVIIKSYAQPGIDMSVIDLTLVSSVKVGITRVTKPIYKVGSRTFIGVKDQLDAGDVIQVGNLGLKYKAQRLMKLSDREWYIYRIRRVDDANTTQLDIDAVSLGDKVRIVSRKTFEQLFNYACSQREEKPIPTTVDLCNTDACDCPIPAPTMQGEPAGPTTPEPRCMQYNIRVPAGVGDRRIDYVDCNGSNEMVIIPDTKTETQYVICTSDITQNVYIGFTVIEEVPTGDC